MGANLGGMTYNSQDRKTTYSGSTAVYDTKASYFSLSINPEIAWFVEDGLAVGGKASLGFNHTTSKSSYTSSTSTDTYTANQPSVYIGPYARYYFDSSEKGIPFVQADVQYGIYSGKGKSTSSTGGSSETTAKPKGDWDAGLSLGYEHFVNENAGIYCSLGINYSRSKENYVYTPSIGTGYTDFEDSSMWYLTVSVGFQLHIPSKTGD